MKTCTRCHDAAAFSKKIDMCLGCMEDLGIKGHDPMRLVEVHEMKQCAACDDYYPDKYLTYQRDAQKPLCMGCDVEIGEGLREMP